MNQLRQCVATGSIIPGRHFRDELANEKLDFQDALRVLKTGQIFSEPEEDIKSGDLEVPLRGQCAGRQIDRDRVLFQSHRHCLSDHCIRDRDEGKAMKKAECSNCGAEARIVKGDYEFKESGLRGAVIHGIDLIRCGKCGNVDPVLSGLGEIMHSIALALLRKPYRLEGEELRFLRKYVDLNQEEFAKLLRVDKTTLSKWENNDDPIGFRSDVWARTVVMSRDKRLEKRAADHIRAFEQIADKQKHVRLEVDAKSHEAVFA